jgi:hypothetical protein
LAGDATMMARVRGVMAARTRSASICQPSAASVGTKMGTPPQKRTKFG